MKSQQTSDGILRRFSLVVMIWIVFGGIAAGVSPGNDPAIKGYDTVAYFKAGQALKGSEAFAFRWHDMTWHFSTEANRELFAASPEQYAPQYDGYCAWAMTEARKAYTDPQEWKVVDGKLYLNCSKSAYEKWSRDIPGNIEKADSNWKRITEGNKAPDK